MHRILLLVATSLMTPMFLALGSQSVRIAIEVSEEGDRRTIEAALVSAFRQVPLVEVVSGSESHQYVVSGVVLCTPNCTAPTSYSLSLRLFERFEPELEAGLILYAIDDSLSHSGLALSVRQRSIIRASLKRYFDLDALERSHSERTLILGTNVYERRFRELAREFDTSCFEKSRMYQRISQATGEAQSRILQEIRRGNWIC